MGDGSADRFRHMDGRQQGALLVPGGTRASLLAGEGHDHLVVAIGPADAAEILVQVATLEEGPHATLDDRAPEAILGRKPLVVDLLEGREVLVQQPPKVGLFSIRIEASASRQNESREIHVDVELLAAERTI
jgi:hypothetical protein